MNTSDKALLTTVSLLVGVAILATAYLFLMQMDYEFIVEAPCDPVHEACFARDCSGGDCPPNGLEQYRVFSVPADEFPKCADNSCLPECDDGMITCTETLCGAAEDDECAT